MNASKMKVEVWVFLRIIQLEGNPGSFPFLSHSWVFYSPKAVPDSQQSHKDRVAYMTWGLSVGREGLAKRAFL